MITSTCFQNREHAALIIFFEIQAIFVDFSPGYIFDDRYMYLLIFFIYWVKQAGYLITLTDNEF